MISRKLRASSGTPPYLESSTLYGDGTGGSADPWYNVDLGDYSPDRLIIIYAAGSGTTQFAHVYGAAWKFSVAGSTANQNIIGGWDDIAGTYGFNDYLYFGGVVAAYYGTAEGLQTVSYPGDLTGYGDLRVLIFRNVTTPGTVVDSDIGTSSGTTDPSVSITTADNGIVVCGGWALAIGSSDNYWITANNYTGLSGITEVYNRDSPTVTGWAWTFGYKILGPADGTGSQSVGVNFSCESPTMGGFGCAAGCIA